MPLQQATIDSTLEKMVQFDKLFNLMAVARDNALSIIRVHENYASEAESLAALAESKATIHTHAEELVVLVE